MTKELMQHETMMVFTGNANPALAKAVTDHLNIPLGKAEVGQSMDNGMLCRC